MIINESNVNILNLGDITNKVKGVYKPMKGEPYETINDDELKDILSKEFPKLKGMRSYESQISKLCSNVKKYIVESSSASRSNAVLRGVSSAVVDFISRYGYTGLKFKINISNDYVKYSDEYVITRW